VVGGWFSDHIRREVGDGARTLFWWDPWLDEGILKDRLNRLFYLSNNKMATVVDMFSLGWEEGGEAWKWRRRLITWEEELGSECCAFLLPIVLQLHASPRYNVASVYNFLTSRYQTFNNDHASII